MLTRFPHSTRNSAQVDFMSENELALIDNWLVFKRANQNCAESTANKYRAYILRLIDFLGDKSLFEASSEDLLTFTGIYLHEQGSAPSSRRAVVAAVKGFYVWLKERGHISFDPSSRVIYPKRNYKVPIAMGLKESERLLMAPDISTFKGLRDAAILSLFIGTGARLSGIRNLNEDDLLRFEYEGINRLAVKFKEKGDKERIIPLPAEAALLLQAYLGHEELKRIDRSLPGGNQVLFVNLKNNFTPSFEYRGESRRLSNRGIQAMVEKYCDQEGIPKAMAHPHALRHLVGAELAEESATEFEMMAILGHSKAETTAIYAKLALKKLTRVIDKSNPLGKINTQVTPLVKQFKESGLI